MKPKKYTHKLRYFTQRVLYNFFLNNVKIIYEVIALYKS